MDENARKFTISNDLFKLYDVIGKEVFVKVVLYKNQVVEVDGEIVNEIFIVFKQTQCIEFDIIHILFLSLFGWF